MLVSGVLGPVPLGKCAAPPGSEAGWLGGAGGRGGVSQDGQGPGGGLQVSRTCFR